MIKNLIINGLLIFSLIGNAFSQNLKLLHNEESQTEEFVMQHKDVEIVIGDLKIKAPFLYKGEMTPRQGYIVNIRDTIRIKDVVEGCQSSCDILVREISESYKNKIKVCQSNCDVRVDKIISEKKSLELKVVNLKEEVKKETRSKYVWAIISSVAGAGIGILAYEISK
tara:strand:+ start:1274 stop:1777 length:504 start_codon:yes stop_codon:yes gene_type:complete